MAQDNTYQTSVYSERGGDRLVIGSGGEVTIESGGTLHVASGGTMSMTADLTMASGADVNLASGATLNVASGAAISMISGATLGLAGGDIAGDGARKILVSEFGGGYTINFSTGISVLAESNIPRNVRYVTVVGSVAASKGSIFLTSVSAGRELFLRLVGDVSGGFTNNNTSLAVIPSGCIILNSLGGAMNSFTMHTSVASDCGVHLIATLDNTWAVVNEIGNNIVES